MRWQESGREEGISIEWESISLHAISNEPVKCIYIMLDVHIDYPPSQGNGQLNNGNDEEMAQDNEDDDDDEGTCEGKAYWCLEKKIDFYFSCAFFWLCR